ncbi:MAG TPA: ATP-grasp domain-containing protein, partial [Noviherbaspirillum sp.]|nr:ATP-grasp domain-containing protein [Noviherbaspirillum sp.]
MSIVIVEPASSGVALVEAAHRMREDVFVLTADQDDRQIPAACRDLATSVIAVDTNDADAVFHAAQHIDRQGKLKAIIPGFEYAVDVVAKAASRLGLPHLSVQAATLTRNKYACRERIQSLGLEVPRYALIGNRSDVERAASEVGFPAVIKPVDGCGSLLVRRVDSLEELHGVLGNAVNTSHLDMGKQVGTTLLLEEFLDGREFSIEGYVDRAHPHVVAITEKQLGPEPFFVEMGHVVPAALPPDDSQALAAYIEQVVRAIGLDLGVFHAEARMTKRGPVLIEIAARLGGDRIYRLVELTQGLSLPATMIR